LEVDELDLVFGFTDGSEKTFVRLVVSTLLYRPEDVLHMADGGAMVLGCTRPCHAHATGCKRRKSCFGRICISSVALRYRIFDDGMKSFGGEPHDRLMHNVRRE
jgi:hypothetical protein